MRVWRALQEAIEAVDRAALVTVLETRGSAPRDAGARLVVRPDGRFSGTIGGGTLEWRAIAEATAELARSGPASGRRRSVALGPELGQCCGGRVELLFETFDGGDRETVASLAAREAVATFETVGVFGGDGRLIRTTADGSGPSSSTSDQLVDLADGAVRERFGEDRRSLMLFGAGHVGRALVMALAPLPFAVTWVDARPDAFPRHVPANVTLSGEPDPKAALAAAPDGAFVLAMTHSHPLDLAVVAAALAAGRFPYVGVIGSATKRARFESQLRAAGHPEAAIAALVCPIGAIGGVTSKEPAAIAAMTAAELLAADEASRRAALPVASPHAAVSIAAESGPRRTRR